jgi:two-component system LytT family response regulator
MIRCIIVDDEQHAIDILQHYIKQTPDLELTGSYTNPVQALQVVNNEKVDLVFLDIQMPEFSGIDFIKAIHQKAKVILTTAYSEFALEGYELEVVDYLLKPIRFPRFVAAVQKVSRMQQENEQGIQEAEEDYIFVKTESKGKLLKINLADIDYIEGMKNYVAIHRGGQKTLVYTNMKDIEARLSKKDFIRVHKSYIIPLSRLTGIEGNKLLLKGISTDIVIGESYKPELMEIIKNRMIQ